MEPAVSTILCLRELVLLHYEINDFVGGGITLGLDSFTKSFKQILQPNSKCIAPKEQYTHCSLIYYCKGKFPMARV